MVRRAALELLQQGGKRFMDSLPTRSPTRQADNVPVRQADNVPVRSLTRRGGRNLPASRSAFSGRSGLPAIRRGDQTFSTSATVRQTVVPDVSTVQSGQSLGRNLDQVTRALDDTTSRGARSGDGFGGGPSEVDISRVVGSTGDSARNAVDNATDVVYRDVPQSTGSTAASRGGGVVSGLSATGRRLRSGVNDLGNRVRSLFTDGGTSTRAAADEGDFFANRTEALRAYADDVLPDEVLRGGGDEAADAGAAAGRGLFDAADSPASRARRELDDLVDNINRRISRQGDEGDSLARQGAEEGGDAAGAAGRQADDAADEGRSFLENVGLWGGVLGTGIGAGALGWMFGQKSMEDALKEERAAMQEQYDKLREQAKKAAEQARQQGQEEGYNAGYDEGAAAAEEEIMDRLRGGDGSGGGGGGRRSTVASPGQRGGSGGSGGLLFLAGVGAVGVAGVYTIYKWRKGELDEVPVVGRFAE